MGFVVVSAPLYMQPSSLSFGRGNSKEMTTMFDLPDDLRRLAPAGLYVGIRFGFVSPQRELNLMPQPWLDRYAREGFQGHDPAIRWAQTGLGVRRWSDLPIDDKRGVLKEAAGFGLRFGAVAATVCEETGQRSILLAARFDRAYTDAQLVRISDHLEVLQAVEHRQVSLTAAELEVLRRIRDGERLKMISHALGVTEGAIKQRLKNARLKLGASTSTQATTMASEMGLL